MSLILEALRKSEAERQIGRAPGLLTPMPIGLRPRRGRSATLVAIIVLLLAAVAGLAWWLGRSSAPASAPTEAELSSSDASPVVVADPATTAPAVPTPASQGPAPAAPIARPSPPQTPALPAAGPGDLPYDPDFVSQERESLPLPPPVVAAPLAPADAPNPAPAAAPAAAAPATEAPAPLEWVTPLRSLGESERTGLPPLRMSMHVYAEVAADRFVLIDGRRRAEGEALGANVQLLEIRRDGAVVEVAGRRLLIERP